MRSEKIPNAALERKYRQPEFRDEELTQIEGPGEIVHEKNYAGWIKHGGLPGTHEGNSGKMIWIPEGDESVLVGLMQKMIHRKIKEKGVAGEHRFVSEDDGKVEEQQCGEE